MSTPNLNTKAKKLAKVQMVDVGLIKTDTMGVNTVGVMNQASTARANLYMDPDTIQAVSDYIFGKSETNPFADITSDVTSKLEGYSEACDAIALNIEKNT